jgi:hypothetical protein
MGELKIFELGEIGRPGRGEMVERVNQGGIRVIGA